MVLTVVASLGANISHARVIFIRSIVRACENQNGVPKFLVHFFSKAYLMERSKYIDMIFSCEQVVLSNNFNEHRFLSSLINTKCKH